MLLKPKEPHVQASGLAWFHGIREEAVADFTVGDCGCGRLAVMECVENVAELHDRLSVMKEGGEFRFGGIS